MTPAWRSRLLPTPTPLGSLTPNKPIPPVSLLRPRSAHAPFLVFDGFLLDLIEPVEPDKRLDVVARSHAFLRAEAGKIPGRPEFLQSALVEMETDEQIKQRVQRHLVTH